MKKFFYLFIIAMTATRLCAIQGDLNGDGRIDIADLVIIGEMLGNTLDKSDAADLNFDGKLDNTDKELLVSNIIYGTPLPQKLMSETFYYPASDQSVSGGGLTINMESINTPTTISFSTMATPPELDWDLGNCSVTPPVFVNGMLASPDIYNASFTLDVPAEHNDKAGKPMLLLGFYGKSPHQTKPQWSYRAIPAEEEFDITYANHKLTWRPDYSLTSRQEAVPFCMAVLYSTRATRSEAETTAPLQTRADGFQFEKVNYLYGYGIYRTKHFCIELHTSVPETQVRALAEELEESYRKIGALGMPQNFGSKWVSAKRIWININKNPLNWKLQRVKSDSAACNAPSLLKAPYIDVPEGAMDSRQRAETCCHELFHYHQYYYAVHATALFLDEMAGTWSEYLVTANPNDYLPDNYVQPRAVINGLYRKSWAESMINGKHYAGEHGYNLVPFARWLTEVKYPGKKLWPAVFSSRSYQLGDGISALQTGIREMDSTDSLATLYPLFIRDYFAETTGIPYKNNPRLLFTQMGMDGPEAAIDRFKETGMLTTIKTAADIFKEENQKHSFVIQNYGAATWRYMFMDPKNFLKDYTNAVVTFSLTSATSSPIMDFTFFAAIYDGVKTTLTEWEEVTVDTEKNTAQMVIPLENLAPEDRNITYFGIVAVYAKDGNPADARQNLTMNIDFTGPIVANGLVGWRNDYLGQQESKAIADLTITPVNGTVLSGATPHIWQLDGGPGFHFPGVDTRLTGADKPKDIMLNITGVIQDVTASIDEPSTLYTAEFPGRVQIIVSKTTASGNADIVTHEELLFDGQNYNPVPFGTYMALFGDGATVSHLLPAAPGKLSNFYLRIPDIDYTAYRYNIQINLPYIMYEKDFNVSSDVREIQIFYLGIKL